MFWTNSEMGKGEADSVIVAITCFNNNVITMYNVILFGLCDCHLDCNDFRLCECSV